MATPRPNPASSFTAPRSNFVSGLAIISAVVALFLSVNELMGLMSYVSITNSGTYRMAMSQLEALAPGANSLLPDSNWIIGTDLISILLNIFSIVASVALFQRREWGRISFVTLAVIQTLFFVGSSIGGYYWVKSMADRSGIGQLLSSAELLTAGLGGLVFASLVVVAISVFIVVKLQSAAVREEFIPRGEVTVTPTEDSFA